MAASNPWGACACPSVCLEPLAANPRLCPLEGRRPLSPHIGPGAPCREAVREGRTSGNTWQDLGSRMREAWLGGGAGQSLRVSSRGDQAPMHAEWHCLCESLLIRSHGRAGQRGKEGHGAPCWGPWKALRKNGVLWGRAQEGLRGRTSSRTPPRGVHLPRNKGVSWVPAPPSLPWLLDHTALVSPAVVGAGTSPRPAPD